MSGHIHEPAYYQGAGGYDLHLADMPFAWRDRSFPVKTVAVMTFCVPKRLLVV